MQEERRQCDALTSEVAEWRIAAQEFAKSIEELERDLSSERESRKADIAGVESRLHKLTEERDAARREMDELRRSKAAVRLGASPLISHPHVFVSRNSVGR